MFDLKLQFSVEVFLAEQLHKKKGKFKSKMQFQICQFNIIYSTQAIILYTILFSQGMKIQVLFEIKS